LLLPFRIHLAPQIKLDSSLRWNDEMVRKGDQPGSRPSPG
jgi:hypothetical protein